MKTIDRPNKQDATCVRFKIGDEVLIKGERYAKGVAIQTIVAITPGGCYKTSDGTLWRQDGGWFRGSRWHRGYSIVTDPSAIVEYTSRKLQEEITRTVAAARRKELENDPEYQAAYSLTWTALTDADSIERWRKLGLAKLQQIQQWLREAGVDI